MSTPRPSMKLLVESGIVPRAPNQRPLTRVAITSTIGKRSVSLSLEPFFYLMTQTSPELIRDSVAGAINRMRRGGVNNL
ncbi:unnamed protein product [Nezara viridula]|uniref:Uncharacterized protein n=1 Tax=Nezara viridula TaxID=85310 RepID=A0A9P0MUN4_NEZVI|nr:unnamed protein product [Nezara viridula]